MPNLNRLAIILSFFLSFVTIASDKKTFKAVVVSPKAIIYNDENMLSPLGYLTNGKTISVGSPRKMNRDLVPVTIKGQLAFIQIKDIQYEDDVSKENTHKLGPPKEHNFDHLIEPPMENFTKNNTFYFTFHRFGAGEETKKAFLEIDNSEKDIFLGFQAQLIHHYQMTPYFWGVGFEYNSAATSTIKFNYYMLAPTFGYTLKKDDFFSFDVYGSLNLATHSQFEVVNYPESSPSPFVWGLQGNARITLFPKSKYHLTGGLGFRAYKVAKLSPLKDLNGNEVDGIKNINGVALFIGMGILLN